MMTEQQEKFLNALFGEAQGNFREAMNIAGYALQNTRLV